MADASPEEHPVEAGPAVQSTTDDPKPVDSAPTQPNPTQEAAAPPPILESLASMGADANVEATPPPVYTARPAATEVGKGLEDSVIQNGEEQVRTRETDVGSYVGDATWEERTWQELVRLKESMFWARVGGVR